MTAAPGERIGWIDAVRGAGTLATLAIAARWMLHPRAHLLDPNVVSGHTAASRFWWYLTEIAADETGFWLVAIALGAGMAAGRAADSEDGWKRSHYARCALLIAAGSALSTGLWAGDALIVLGMAALFVTATVQDPNARPWAVAAAATAIGAAGAMPWVEGQGLLLLGSRLPHEAVAFGNAGYNAWESEGLRGSLSAATAVRTAQTLDQFETLYPYRMLWQAGGGMLAGIWWQRAGRDYAIGALSAPALTAAGGSLTALAAYHGAAHGYEPVATSVAQSITYTGGAVLAAGVVVGASRRPAETWQTGAGRLLATYGRRSLTGYLAGIISLGAFAQGWAVGLHGQLLADETVALTLVALGVSFGIAAAHRFEDDRQGGAEGALRLAVRLLCGRRRRRSKTR